MRLTRYSDYALRTALYLAARPGELSAIADIASAYQIPENNLRKVVNDLVRKGYFESVRGRLGGVKLGMAPEDVRIGDVLRVTEGEELMVDCTGCFLAPSCGLIPGLRDAKNAFFDSLNRYTLADLVNDRVRMLATIGADRRARPQAAEAV